MKELKATRVPPGDRWAIVDDDEERVYSSFSNFSNICAIVSIAVDLAQFSQLEQLARMNKNMEAVATEMIRRDALHDAVAQVCSKKMKNST